MSAHRLRLNKALWTSATCRSASHPNWVSTLHSRFRIPFPAATAAMGELESEAPRPLARPCRMRLCLRLARSRTYRCPMERSDRAKLSSAACRRICSAAAWAGLRTSRRVPSAPSVSQKSGFWFSRFIFASCWIFDQR